MLVVEGALVGMSFVVVEGLGARGGVVANITR